MTGVLVDEMGVAISQAPTSTFFVSAVFDYYAGLARTFQFERQVVSGPSAR